MTTRFCTESVFEVYGLMGVLLGAMGEQEGHTAVTGGGSGMCDESLRGRGAS